MSARHAAWLGALGLACSAGRVAPSPVRLDAPARSTGEVILDVPYVASGEPTQQLDVYTPAARGFSTVVFVYGGGWHSGSRKCCTDIARRLVALGFGCVLVSHRLTPPAVFPAHAEDVAAAFAWTRAHVADHGGDPRRVFLAGHSSGAQLALIVATDPRYLAAHQLAPGDVAGVVGLSAPVELAPAPDGQGFGDRLLAGKGADVFSRDPVAMRDASPLSHVGPALPPALLVVGERDFPMLAADARAFAARASKLGHQVPVVIARGRDHLGVVAALAEPSSDVLDAVVAFLRR